MPSAKARSEPLLDAHDIQGNILAGFRKDQQQLVAVRFQDLTAARRWLRRIAGQISSLELVSQFNALFKKARIVRGEDPVGLVATWVNIAFSRPGLGKLCSEADANGVSDEAFQTGLPARAESLGDLDPGGNPDVTARWKIGGTGNVPDALLIVASDSIAELTITLESVRPNGGDGPGEPEVLWEELGITRADLPGHEHFGFKDGVSQPGVRGRISAKPDVLLTPRTLATPTIGGVEFSRPGEPLVWPGQFVFGYPSTDRDTGGPRKPGKLTPAWLKNGSLLVFRRLQQDVAGFSQFVKTTAATIPGMTPARLGALLVGRWKSGAPVARAQSVDIPGLGGSALANNDFLFTVNSVPPVFLPGVKPPTAYPAAVADANGFICPHAAHIRKMNPRDHDSDKGDQFDTLTRRILRRGIPYGPPILDPFTDDGVDRGLHFLSYQTSIVQQFELLQQDWANNTVAPVAGGHDVVIGQTDDKKRTFDLVLDDGANLHTIVTPTQWVIPTGGGYFFAPSISALRDILSVQ